MKNNSENNPENTAPSNNIPTSSQRKFFYRLKELGFNSYEEYLQSDLWKEFRKKYYRSKKTKKFCLVCEEFNYDIELHHKTYDRLGCERITDITPLCRYHHEQLHEYLNKMYQGRVEYTNSVIAFCWPKNRSRGKPQRRGRKRKDGGKNGGRKGSYDPDV